MNVICFEDRAVSQLHPITCARPAYAITCASFQLIDWLRELPGTLTVSVRSYLSGIESLDRQLVPPQRSKLVGSDVLLVNARLVPRVELAATLGQLCAKTTPCVIRCGQTKAVLAARLTPTETAGLGDPPSGNDAADEVASPFRKSVRNDVNDAIRSSDDGLVDDLLSLLPDDKDGTGPDDSDALPTFDWPHDVVSWHMRGMPSAMNWRLDRGGYRETSGGVFVRDGVSIGQYAVVDTSEGPILLDEDVSVGPFCYLAGPVYAGPRTRVIEHAALKDGVALGHTVKIGGEVEASVIEPYSNKQHHGFLGHSYLGSWINLGAGTCNSDLKNTYGKINIEYGGQKVSTGMQFLGCIMGDYSKTAINTSIFTGKVIGVCSMLYGFATSNVPSFVNYARLFGQQSPLPAEVMVNTQQRMFARRKVRQRDVDVQLIHDMYRLTAPEREQAEQYGY